MHPSADGFLLMTLEDALVLPFTHLISGLDEPSDDIVATCGSCTAISGYTEWIASTDPLVTVGWDWVIDAANQSLRWVRVGPPRSNVLLIDATECPYDWTRNEAVLATVVDAIPWEEQARSAVTRRYSRWPGSLRQRKKYPRNRLTKQRCDHA